jgi:cytidine deaminase
MPEFDNLPHVDALNMLVKREPQRHDLIVGFVGAIGTPWEPVIRGFEESFKRFDYEVELIHLASLLDDLEPQVFQELPERHSAEYYERRMNAGDKLRSSAGNAAAMAALAVRQIVRLRKSRTSKTPVVYLLRSLKHPGEIDLLRYVYGSAFFAVGVVCSAQERREVLSDALSLFEDHKSRVEQLIARDQEDNDNREYGQKVRDAYELADAYVPGNRGIDVSLEIDRFVDTIFGAPFVTPTPGEEAMFFAHGASLRSAAAGRQVGATLLPVIGTPVVAGVNEVPRPGGGQYWAGDSPDYRDFRAGRDPNPNFVQELIQDLLVTLKNTGLLKDDLNLKTGPELLELAQNAGESATPSLRDARVTSLIEFTRCLHAEQAAIINAARGGVTTQGATLYSTTFPCHECAKMIVGAGISEVHYIEPYPKSLVDRLFRNEIDTSPDILGDDHEIQKGKKLPFFQFTGIAPRWYSQAFRAQERRTGNNLVDFVRSEANPRSNDWIQIAVEELESGVIESIAETITGMTSRQTVDPDSSDPEIDSEQSYDAGTVSQLSRTHEI